MRKFCELIDISPTFISRMERAKIPAPGEAKIMAMAQVLEVDSEELIFRAKRIPEAIKKMIIDRPEIVPILRLASTKTPADLKRMFDLMAGQKD